MNLKSSVMAIGIAGLIMSGCGTMNDKMSYSQYQENVELCKQLNLDVRVINGVRDNKPYVRDVICYDRRGANWNAEQLSDD